MPRVTVRKKSTGGKYTYTCDRCGEQIKPGQEFYTWSFRYGGSRYRHTTHPAPRPSELTQSLMSTVYAAQEAFSDLGPEASWEDKAAGMRELAEAAEEVAGQYREAAENFGGGGENAERADELESWASELDEAASTLEQVAETISEAEDAIGKAEECPL